MRSRFINRVVSASRIRQWPLLPMYRLMPRLACRGIIADKDDTASGLFIYGRRARSCRMRDGQRWLKLSWGFQANGCRFMIAHAAHFYDFPKRMPSLLGRHWSSRAQPPLKCRFIEHITIRRCRLYFTAFSFNSFRAKSYCARLLNTLCDDFGIFSLISLIYRFRGCLVIALSFADIWCFGFITTHA